MKGVWVMKKTIIFSFIVFLVCNNKSFCQIVSIDDVKIIPDQPFPYENITIQVFGGFSSMGPYFNKSIFSIDDFFLQLDLFFTDDFCPAIPEPWSHDESIGMLFPGSYDLLVQAHWRSTPESDYILHDT